ncbi:hypothetical protein E2P81_ATG10375 [Venturia nashicola]|nr:hypothetical protein E2P81_ATG10375 [Venturia nashicola]
MSLYAHSDKTNACCLASKSASPELTLTSTLTFANQVTYIIEQSAAPIEPVIASAAHIERLNFCSVSITFSGP